LARIAAGGRYFAVGEDIMQDLYLHSCKKKGNSATLEENCAAAIGIVLGGRGRYSASVLEGMKPLSSWEFPNRKFNPTGPSLLVFVP